MNNQNPLLGLSARELKEAIALKERIEDLQSQLARLLGGTGGGVVVGRRGRRTMSAAARGRIAAAQRARWAKVHARQRRAAKPRARRKVSAAARARLSALAKARWAKAKKAGRTRL